jgi:hypothetical protein
MGMEQTSPRRYFVPRLQAPSPVFLDFLLGYPLRDTPLTPSYLGDILTHLSFPLLLYANDLFHPALLLGPLTNYLFLRHISGDKENEQNQVDRYAASDPAKLAQFNAYKDKKNAVWPRFHELTNVWTWAAVAAGVGAVGLVRFLDRSRVL